MQDLMFKIAARDTTQAAFNSAQRNARAFTTDIDRSGRAIRGATDDMQRFASATDRAAAAGKRLTGVNDNWRRNNLRMQMFDVGQMLALGQNPAMTAMQQGPQIAQMYAGQGGLRAAGADLLGVFGRMGPIALAAGAVVGGVFLGMQSEIEAATGVAVSFGDVAGAAFSVIGDKIYGVLQPAIEAIAPWFATAWDIVKTGVKAAGNFFIAAWSVTFDAMNTGIMAVPDAFIAAGEAAANGFLTAIEEMIQEVLAGINGLLTDVNALLPMGHRIGLAPSPESVKLDRVDLGGTAARERLANGWDGFSERSKNAFSRDYMGDFYQEVSDGAVANAMARIAAEAEKSGAAMKKAANDNIDPWANLRDVSDGVREKMQEIERQAKAIEDAWQRFGDGAIDVFTGLATGTMSWADALRAAIPLVKDLITNLLSAKGGGSGGGGGFLGFLSSLFGGGGGGLNVFPAAPGGMTGLFAEGGYTGAGSKYQPAGIVHAGEYVLSANATRRIGRGRLDMMNRGYADGGYVTPHMQAPANQNSGAVTVDARTTINAPNADAAEVARLLRQRDAELPGKILATITDARRRNAKI